MMKNTRDDFHQSTKQQLASRVGYRCSNPDCRKLTIGPSVENKKSVNIGVAAHITAAAKGGKRYDSCLSSHERKDFNNGIWLCQNCAKLIDSDDKKYTVQLIKTWKSTAEQLATTEIESVSSLHAKMNNEEIRLYRTPMKSGLYQNEWLPTHELFSCQVNLFCSEYFVGRAQECSTLMSLVEDGNKVLISGMGGIGKTELARWVHQQCLNDNTFQYVGFLSYRDSADSTVLKVFNSSDDLTKEERITSAWNNLHQLAQTSRVLLIVDNVNKTMRQDPSLQRLLNLSCVVILTSRSKTIRGFRSFPIFSLKLAEGIKLFKNVYGPISEHETNILTTIVQEIAYCHPLTIKIVASIGKSRGIALSKLRSELETMKFSLVYLDEGEPIRFAEEYLKLFKLAGLSNQEIKMLECFSILPYTLLPKECCMTMMQEDVADTHGMILDMLAQKNWLEESADGFGMHPLIAETLRFSRPFLAQEHPSLLTGTTEAVIRLENQTLSQDAVPYTDVVLAIANHYCDLNPKDSIFLCVVLSRKYAHVTRYNLMCDLLEKTLTLAGKTQIWGLFDIVLYHLCYAYLLY